jgi:tetratricopeptide (TPR) repeat protein
MNTKAFEEAVTVGERYLSLTPTDRQAWVLLAQGHLALYDRQLYEGQKNPKHLLAAELACESAVEADPADAVAVYATLYNYFSDRNWWVHALYYNNRALKLTEQDSPDYEAFEHNRSWIPANRIAGKSWDIEVIAPSSAAPGPASAGGEDLLQATAAMKEKNYRQARRSLQQAAQRAPDDPLVRYHQTLMRMFDEAVVQGTITQLQELRDAVKAGAGINLDTFEVFMEPFEGYLKRDPTSPEIQEAFGDIFAADPGGLYRKSALPYYEKAIELGGDRARLSEKIQTIRSANH